MLKKEMKNKKGLNQQFPRDPYGRSTKSKIFLLVITLQGDFSGGPVVRTSPSSAGGAGSIPSWGAKIPHASWPKNQNIKQKQYCNKFNKDFKNGPYQKIF